MSPPPDEQRVDESNFQSFSYPNRPAQLQNNSNSNLRSRDASPAPNRGMNPRQDSNLAQLAGSPPASTGKTVRTCRKCEKSLTGQFVRALGTTFHLDCFRCKDCGVVVANKFFPVDDENGKGQYPLCETDYFRRLDLLCHSCGGALRGSYITALDRKYHIEHFTCCVCPTVFGPQDSYYEHDGQVYCHYHYSTQFAAKCNGCQTAILKQFVEIFRNGQDQHWHPECYMIHKFWNVRLAPADQTEPAPSPVAEGDPSESRRSVIREAEEQMEDKVYRIWSVLSTFEESSAACISDMLLHVSNGAYVDGVVVAEKFILHVEILFVSVDQLDASFIAAGGKGGVLSYSREAKLLCKKIVAFFSLISKSQETGVRKLGVTQELLSLVTGLAHYLKLLIRISLQGALRLERDHNDMNGLNLLLHELANTDAVKESNNTLDMFSLGNVDELADGTSDTCPACSKTVEDECIQSGGRRWHKTCVQCSGCGRQQESSWYQDRDGRLVCRECAQRSGIQNKVEMITKLKQFVFLLRVALARLLVMLKQGGTLPHTSDDPNLSSYDSTEGHKVASLVNPAMLRSDTRSKSYGGNQGHEEYENTLSDIRRFRSQRLDKQLGTSVRRARQSRIIEGPEAEAANHNNSDSPQGDNGESHLNKRRMSQFRVVEEKNGSDSDITFTDDKTLRLDDIPRIVAAEQARSQRPNAFKHARASTFDPLGLEPKIQNGHQRDLSFESPQAKQAPQARPQKRYFSELSAIDYFIVRHIAVLSMEPLVQEYFNLEELLGLIETRKVNFWGRFGRAFKPEPKKQGKKKGVFGVALDVLVDRDGADSTHGVGPGTLRIPAILDDAVVAMRGMDMSVEGVFRKNGNIRRLKDLAESIDRGVGDVEMSGEGAVQIAALLRKFLRELPDPLLTFKLHRLFITSQKLPDEETRRRVLHLTCCLLPKHHRDAMEILFSFLNWVASFSHIDEDNGSKMDIHNLATVITPNILCSKNKDAGMEDSFLAIEAVHTLIEYNEAMCEVPEDILSILNDSNLFANSAELTTKDILKRYGDIVNRPSPARVTAPASNTPPRSKDGRSPSTPAFHRVDENPQQNIARQREGVGQVLETAPNRDTVVLHGHGRGESQVSLNHGGQLPPQGEQYRAPSWDRRTTGNGQGGPPPHQSPHQQQQQHQPVTGGMI